MNIVQLNKIVTDVLITFGEWMNKEWNHYYDGRSSMVLEIIHSHPSELKDNEFKYIFETVMITIPYSYE